MLDHVSLIKDKTPAYSATSVECRADGETFLEQRATVTDEPELIIENKIDYSEYEERIRRLDDD